MKAIFVKKAGDPEVLECREVEQPISGERELLVKVRAATVTRGDVALRGMPWAILVPRGRFTGVKSPTSESLEFVADLAAAGHKRGNVGITIG